MEEQHIDQLPRFPDIATLHERHHGLTQTISRYYAEAAAVCLSRHHTPPHLIAVEGDGRQQSYRLDWLIPSAAAGRTAWANVDDATRDAAYGIVLAAVECHLGLVAVARARTKSGADYLVGPVRQRGEEGDPDLDFEGAWRLEISGFDEPSSEAELRRRLRVKMEQTRRAGSVVPALAGVVGISLCVVVFGRAH